VQSHIDDVCEVSHPIDQGLYHFEHEVSVAGGVERVTSSVSNVTVNHQTTSGGSNGSATVKDVHGLSGSENGIRVLLEQVSQAYDLQEYGVSNRTVEKALTQDVELSKKLVMLSRILDEGPSGICDEVIGWKALAVDVVEVVGEDFRTLVRQLDDAGFTLDLVLIQSRLEEFGIARDEVGMSEYYVLRWANV
jgi:hypothetical protein